MSPGALTAAFASFTEVASSLERCYTSLQEEVGGLRQELTGSRQELESSLAENGRMRSYLRHILEALPCGVGVVEAGGEFRALNPAAVQMLGCGRKPTVETRPRPESKSQKPEETPWDAVLLPAEIEFAIAQSRSRGRETECLLAEPLPGIEAGTIPARWLALRLVPFAREGSANSSVLILRDVTEQKKLEREREGQQRERVLAEVAVVLAHEVRNPLASLELFAELLGDAELPTDRQKWTQHLRAGLRTLAATVNNVLHYGTEDKADRKPVDLGELLAAARSFLTPLAAQSGVRILLNDCLGGTSLAADGSLLRQALLNLALNALRVMPGGGVLELAGKIEISDVAEDKPGEEGKTAVLTVSDNGPGISASLERIFESGFSTRPGSPGLGLAVARRIVSQHQGTICASNRSSGGASFEIRIPMTMTMTETEKERTL